MFGQLVLASTKCVRCLYKFSESVLTTAKCVGGSNKLCVRFDNRKGCRRLIKVGTVRFNYRKACIYLVLVWRVGSVLTTAKRELKNVML